MLVAVTFPGTLCCNHWKTAGESLSLPFHPQNTVNISWGNWLCDCRSFGFPSITPKPLLFCLSPSGVRLPRPSPAIAPHLEYTKTLREKNSYPLLANLIKGFLSGILFPLSSCCCHSIPLCLKIWFYYNVSTYFLVVAMAWYIRARNGNLKDK